MNRVVDISKAEENGRVVKWLVEIEGRQRPSAELMDADFASAVNRLQHFFAKFMTDTDYEQLQRLDVVCRFDPESGLRFSLQGPTNVVELAIDRIGQAYLSRQDHLSITTVRH